MLTLADFKGEWRITREITDRLTGNAGRLEGTATFTDDAPDTLLYEERGRLRLGDGPEMAATRRYRWHFADGRVDMTFDDGSAFHSFVPHSYVSGTDHQCGDDAYAVRYDFIPWPRWRAVWVVTGPRKDYTSVTEFTR
ncbi:DUF6314 family protein [Yoonia sp. R2-816]|uniref:DUF6314 family protein n=1 Tax=Yoonia sp. R2-816 TaxID=3342638 RepID=UPI0037270CDE